MVMFWVAILAISILLYVLLAGSISESEFSLV